MSAGRVLEDVDGPYALTWSRDELTAASTHLLENVLPRAPERSLALWLARLIWRRERGSIQLLRSQWRTRQFLMERHLDSPVVWRLCQDPELRRRLTEHLGDALVLWRSEIWVNRPDERVIPVWHHDAYPRLLQGEGQSVNAYIALTDVDEDNGLEYLPASALSGRVLEPVRTDGYSGNHFFRVPPELEERAVPLRLRAGEFVLFSDDLVHRSVRNTSGRVRVALTLRVAPPSLQVLPGYTPSYRPVAL